MLPGLTAPQLQIDSTTDSALIAELIAQEYPPEPRSDGRDLEIALEKVLPRLEGGFSLVLMDDARLVGVRDRHGFWPLVLGRLENGWVLASETAALDIVGAHFVREVEPGEMIVIDANGMREHRFAEADPKLCLFEFVYFARPDTYLYGKSVHAARQRMGEALARQAPVDADMVMPVPESGIPAAQGYARSAGIPYGDGLVKNRYVGRTFIQPSAQMRAGGVRLKLNPLPENIRGKRLVVVDDSIVRGTTTPGHRDAARGRCGRGALPGVVAAVPVAVLLRHGHGPSLRAARGRPLGGRDRRLPQGRLARLPRARPTHRGDGRAG